MRLVRSSEAADDDVMMLPPKDGRATAADVWA